MCARAGVRVCVMASKDDLLKIKGAIFDLPQERQEAIKRYQAALIEMLQKGGEDAALAICLVVQEIINDDQ